MLTVKDKLFEVSSFNSNGTFQLWKVPFFGIVAEVLFSRRGKYVKQDKSM